MHPERTAVTLTVTNPYLDEFTALGAVGDHKVGSPAWTKAIMARSDLTRKYAWAIPDMGALAAIVACGPIVEIGAGAGYWASLVAAAGGDIVAYDTIPVGTGENSYLAGIAWFDVVVGDATAVLDHQNRALLLCWPPYDHPLASECLELYTGDTVVYVGEYRGGCNAEDSFFDQLETGFDRVERVAIPRWEGMHDELTVWTRR
jgi:hypothetical protein